MKVKFEEDYKSRYTLLDVANAKAVIASEKEDEETAAGWLAMAAREALKGAPDSLVRIIEATASTAKNCRVWDAYGETANMDVWVQGIAETAAGFLKVGGYLSDIWQTGGTDYREHLFCIRYGRV